MKRFIFCLLLGVGTAVVAWAQTSNEAVPFIVEAEEDEILTTETTENDELVGTEEAADDMPSSQEVQEEVAKDENTEVSNSTEEEVEEEEDDDEEQLIYVALNDIQSNLTSVRAVSYCSGVFVLFNSTKKHVQEISGTIDIGDQTKKFKFADVAPGTSFGWPIHMVGQACESILALPKLQFQTCKVKGMSDKKCRAKLRYVPLTSS